MLSVISVRGVEQRLRRIFAAPSQCLFVGFIVCVCARAAPRGSPEECRLEQPTAFRPLLQKGA